MVRSSSFYFLLLYCAFGIAAFLVLISGGNRRAIRWKLAVGTLILSLAAPALTVVSCRSGSSVESRKQDVWARDGWIDDDTFRQKGIGTPRMGYTNIVMRKGSAKQAAILNAQHGIIEKFRNYAVPEACCYVLMSAEPSFAWTREMTGIVKGGTILAEKFDTEDSCEIVYELKYKGLKQKVMKLQ